MSISTTPIRNARFGNGVTAVAAQDFQRGVFRNRIAVDRMQLQQASLVRGAVPVTPTREQSALQRSPGVR